MINQSDATNPGVVRSQASLRDYLAIARFDHMTKHVFIIRALCWPMLSTRARCIFRSIDWWLAF